MIGRVGSCFGSRGINISSASVGRQPPHDEDLQGKLAVMAITTDGPVPDEVVDEIVAMEGFVAGRAVSLAL
jgi:D-3-phosphoglycerate dehydrogenase